MKAGEGKIKESFFKFGLGEIVLVLEGLDFGLRTSDFGLPPLPAIASTWAMGIR